MLMPIIGALIGWGTNLLAIKLIFRPLNPVTIPILGIKFQGLIPKRRLEIARSIGEALENEIISAEDIMDNLVNDKTKAEIIKTIKNMVVEKTVERLPAFIPSIFKSTISEHLGDMVNQHGNSIFDELKDTMINKAKEELDLRSLVETKINSFDIEQLESLIIDLSHRELKQIEVLGGILGFIIGIFQALFSYYLM